MTSGGARNKSGPPKDPSSRTSERAGYTLTALPAGGYTGRAPAFPLPQLTRYNADGPSPTMTKSFRAREIAVWREAWKTPQACAWSTESWRWPTIGEFCRLKVIVESTDDPNASLVGQLHRFRDQIGLTPAGLKENGWAIARNQLADKSAEKAAAKKPASGDEVGQRRQRRLRGDAQ